MYYIYLYMSIFHIPFLGIVIMSSNQGKDEKQYDRFGNSLTEPTRLEDMPAILQRVRDLVYICYAFDLYL